MKKNQTYSYWYSVFDYSDQFPQLFKIIVLAGVEILSFIIFWETGIAVNFKKKTKQKKHLSWILQLNANLKLIDNKLAVTTVKKVIW